MVASPHVWREKMTPRRNRPDVAWAPYLPYPRFLRDLHDLLNVPECALPHRLRSLAQRLFGVRHVCVLTPEVKDGATVWSNAVEEKALPKDAQGHVVLPCGYAVPTEWFSQACLSLRILVHRAAGNRYLLGLAVRGTQDVVGMLIVSQEGPFELEPAIREAALHLCRGVGTAWENRRLRSMLTERAPSAHDLPTPPTTRTSGVMALQRERALRRRAEEAESVSRFLANASTLLGTSLDYNTTIKQALRLAIPYLGTAAQLDILLPNRRVARWRGRLSRDTKMEACLAKVVEMDDTDPRFAVQRGALHVVGATLVSRSFSRQQVMVSLYSRGKVLGVMTVVRTMQLRKRSRGRGGLGCLLECFGRRVAAALDNAQLHAQLMRAVRVRNEFLAMASHELRTPVMAMSLKLEHLLRSLRAGHVSQLSGDALKQHMTTKLDGALQCSDRLSQLVANLVDVSHLRADHMTLTRGRCSLSDCVESVMGSYQAQFIRRGCALVCHIEPQVWGFWDRQRIEQMVNHLLSNAIKYGAGRPIELTVAHKEGMAMLRITDQGIGIDPESVQRIFGRFERATSIRSYGGFGLGLYITREIISAHGGVLDVCSTPQQGATFEVRLPVGRLPMQEPDSGPVCVAPAPRA